VNEARRQAFLKRLAYDLAAAHSAALVVLGDRLGLYRALADGALTPSELARRTGTHERYVREWLRNQTIGGYVEQHGEGFALSDEQALALASEGALAFAVPAFQLAAGLCGALDAAEESFRTGAGLDPARYPSDVRQGIARGCAAMAGSRLVEDWIPADVSAQLERGAAAVDLGCGRGGTVLALARAFPRAHVLGLDVDEPALAEARLAAAGLGDRVRFEAASVEALTDRWELVTCIDTLHDLPDPLAAARAIRTALSPTGCALIIEPTATGRPEVFARLLSAISTLYCVPIARAGGGQGQGALGNEEELTGLLSRAGFGRVAVRERLPLHAVIEARP